MISFDLLHACHEQLKFGCGFLLDNDNYFSIFREFKVISIHPALNQLKSFTKTPQGGMAPQPLKIQESCHRKML